MFLNCKLLLVDLLLLCIAVNALEEFEWMYLRYYGDDVTLRPLKRNDTDIYKIDECKWLTPANVELYPEQVNLHSDRYYIDKTTCELTIFNIQKDTNGIYHCIINRVFISKAMLNYHGPPPKDFLDEYKWNFIAGFSTSGGILALFLFIYVIQRFKYREPVKFDNYKTTGYEMSIRRMQNVAAVESISGYENQIEPDTPRLSRHSNYFENNSNMQPADDTANNQVHRF